MIEKMILYFNLKEKTFQGATRKIFVFFAKKMPKGEKCGKIE